MKRYDFLILSILAALLSAFNASAQEIPEGYELVDSVVYRHVAGVDTLLAGRDIFHIMPLKANGGKVGEFMCNCLQQYAALYQNLAGLPGAVLHDSLPLAWVLDESVAELEHHYVEVALDGHLTRGETVVDRRLQLGKAPNCYVAMRADRDKLIAMHLEAVKKFG